MRRAAPLRSNRANRRRVDPLTPKLELTEASYAPIPSFENEIEILDAEKIRRSRAHVQPFRSRNSSAALTAK